jgi:hypothetical protein
MRLDTSPIFRLDFKPLHGALLLAAALFAVLTIGLSPALADPLEEGGGEGPLPTEPVGEIPPVEIPLPPVEPVEPSPESESPSDPPSNPGGPSSEPGGNTGPSGGSQQPANQPHESSGPASTPGSTATPAGGGGSGHRHHSSRGPTHSAGSALPAPHKGSAAGGGGNTQSTAGDAAAAVTNFIGQVLPTSGLERVGSELAVRAGLAPAHDKAAQRDVVARLGNAVAAAALGSAVTSSSPASASGPPHASPFVPLHGKPKVIFLILLVASMGIAVMVIGAQFRTALRTRRY